MPDLSRRGLLTAAAALGLASLAQPVTALRAQGLELGPPEPFDFELVRSLARSLAALPHVEPPLTHEDFVRSINPHRHGRIRFKPEYEIWQESLFPLRPHHRGHWFPYPVGLNIVEDGQARKLIFNPDAFDYSELGIEEPIPDDLGFAGFRLMNGPESTRDWLSFLGASYFRASGEQDQYGASARAVAIDTALPEREEEFPYFSRFWVERAPQDSRRVLVYALLEGASLTGAYRFDIRYERGVVMEVESELSIRKSIERLGFSPLTSMYWFGQHDREQAADWRPRIHDSDGLAMWTGAGERIWRPLNNPGGLRSNSFLDTSPRGFGLMQRERRFDAYQDDSHFYERRPSVWVEPLGDWGSGSVQLIEIPTDHEDMDNIVAFWVPQTPPEPGSRLSLSYRLHWLAEEPYPPRAVARVVATRSGPAGVPGNRTENGRKFVIDFEGGPLEELVRSEPVEPVISAPSGEIQGPYAIQIVGTNRWRAVFDLVGAEGDALDLRLYLRLGKKTLSETWLYQYLPQQA
ncbi:glucan biosynthesis protein [Aquibaculum arenosum]|uniref:Glucan biosynthesis protein n=1 Tax=Aquibaculum arenosum TaxID=3032591 RepID=A0ABT5YJM1_9PROT|nr:glucan biosynthesis protein [Fodinicurvata sp. CAU 1616]MDF2095147.1 glucan biosynthesis protein [Fodinicurvata sp. CAU 1616]